MRSATVFETGVAMAQVEGSGGVAIHYAVTGQGPAILWHTGGCGDGTMWERAGYLAAFPEHRHVLLDHRGHGASGAPPDLAGHAMDAYVGDVLAVLEDAGIDRAAFVGYSFGAHVGFATGLVAPERLSALVALDSVPDPTATPEAARSEIRAVLERGSRALIEEYAVRELEPPPAWLIEHLSATDPLAFAGALEAEATEPDLWGNARDFAVPTLFLLATGDAADPADEGAQWWEWGRVLAGRMPAGEALALAGIGHLAAFWRADATVPLIRDFLARRQP
jgi:pimeloyl-ACP methyl ester carboxylesterase